MKFFRLIHGRIRKLLIVKKSKLTFFGIDNLFVIRDHQLHERHPHETMDGWARSVAEEILSRGLDESYWLVIRRRRKKVFSHTKSTTHVQERIHTGVVPSN